MSFLRQMSVGADARAAQTALAMRRLFWIGIISLGLASCGSDTTNPGDGGQDAGSQTQDSQTGNNSCAQLNACCPGVPAQNRSVCIALVTADNERRCADNLVTFTTAGFCDGSFDGGVGGDASVMGPQCNALDDCCDRVPASSEPSCRAIAVLGEEQDCQEALDGLSLLCT